MVNHCVVVGCTTMLGRNQGYVFTASRVNVSPRGNASGQQQFGKQTGRQESMHASVASTSLQVCNYLIGDRMLDVTLCSSVLASGEPHRQAGHPDYVASVFPAVYKQANRKEDQRGQRYSSRGGLNRHCRSQ